MKQKTCKNGIGKAIGFEGCGKETFKTTFGLCPSCLYSFYTTDERGKILYQKSFLPKVSLKLKSFDKAKTKQMREDIKTLSDYANELQRLVNTIIRLIDKGSQCISTLKPLNDKFDAGHMYSVGSNPALRFHLDNIHAQSVYANQYLSGDQINYINGLSEVYGTDYKEYVLSLKSRYKVLKLSKEELKEKIVIAKDIVKNLKYADLEYKSQDRVYLRNLYNERLGIYG